MIMFLSMFVPSVAVHPLYISSIQIFSIIKKCFTVVAVSLLASYSCLAPAGYTPNASVDLVFPDGGRSIVCNELLKELVQNRFCPSCHIIMTADRFATRQNSIWCHFQCCCCGLQQCFETLPGATSCPPEQLQSTVTSVFVVLATGQHYKQYKKSCLLQGLKPIPETTFFNIEKQYSINVETAAVDDCYMLLKDICKDLPRGTLLPLSWDFQWSQRSQAFTGAGHLVAAKAVVPAHLGKKNIVVWSKSLVKDHNVTLKGGRKIKVVQKMSVLFSLFIQS
jgi:hypothetical protein